MYKSYQENNTQVNILNNINLNISDGEMISIVGNSGSGKSTLLHLLGGLDKPTSGEIVFLEQQMSLMSSADKADLRNREIGFIYQFHHLLSNFTVLENVALPLLISKKKLNKFVNYANDVLHYVGLSHKKHYFPAELSGGERQRVAIARALVNNPRLVLADEPTGNLDTSNTNNVFQILCKLNATYNTTFLVVTHNAWLAKRMNRQLKMCDGWLSDITKSSYGEDNCHYH